MVFAYTGGMVIYFINQLDHCSSHDEHIYGPSAKYIVMAALFIVGIVSILSPIFVSRQQTKISNKMLNFGKHFGTGVILSTAYRL